MTLHLELISTLHNLIEHILTATRMKMAVSWDVAPCTLV